uniref:Uncharacterized protein n=1 Tax=Cyprinus carpio TaxID=7962 RepID=A0A8C1YFJ3_CYPCA
MASLHVSGEEIFCPVCREIFKTPVLLSCSHSFCKECLHKFWRNRETQECPVCRRRSSKLDPPVNLALQNLCESCRKERKESRSSGSEEICSLHSEKLKLFCLEDKQPVCVECVTSQQHINHTFRPISEAVPLHKNKNDLIKKSILIEDGNPARYRLQTRTDRLDQSEPYRKITFGERIRHKPHKTILMVGETGTGKTTLINVMINYMLGVQREDKVWFEITDDQSDRTSVHSQTSSITVYGFYLQESPIHLTIIDTPGYGNTHGIDLDKDISTSLHRLSELECWVQEIDAVCLVIMAHQNRLSDRQIYIFDALQTLFGRDIADNIILLFTHSTGAPPKNALTAVKEANIKCAVNDKIQPVFFLFDNCQTDAVDEEHETIQEQSWNLSFRGMKGLFQCLDKKCSISLKLTQDVLQKREQLEANISNLQSHVQKMKEKENKLKQTQETLKKNQEYVKNDENFEYEVEVPYKEKVDVDPAVASMAMCCSVCEENCHYPGCWWVSNLSWCSVMKNYHCTVCTNKCHYSKHVKTAKIYVTNTKKEKRTNEDLKKELNKKIGHDVSSVKKLEDDLQELEEEKINLVNEVFHSTGALQKIALNTDSLITFQHIDFLTETLKEINEPEKAKTLENFKMRAVKKQGALGYFGYCFKK